MNGSNLVACLIDRLMVLAAAETVQVGGVFQSDMQPAGSMSAGCSRQVCTNLGYPRSLGVCVCGGVPPPNLTLHQTGWSECYWRECC